jgi:hypothetical protein
MANFTYSTLQIGSMTLHVYEGDSYRGGSEQVFYNITPPGMTYVEKYNPGQPDERDMVWPLYLKTYLEFKGMWFSSMISGQVMKVYYQEKLTETQYAALNDAYLTHKAPIPIPETA